MTQRPTLGIYEPDSLEFQTIVYEAQGNDPDVPKVVKDLSNASAEAHIELTESLTIPAVCQITQPTQGAVNVFFPEGSFNGRPGKYNCAVRIKEPGQRSQTVLIVRVGIRALS